MLLELSKHNDIWLEFAKRTCKDEDLAKDIVQDMYIYFSDKYFEVKKVYVYKKIYHLFIDHCRKEEKINKTSIENLYYLEDKTKRVELDDKGVSVLNKHNNLHWIEKELINKHHIQGMSLRSIEKELPLFKYGYTFNIIKNAKNKLNG